MMSIWCILTWNSKTSTEREEAIFWNSQILGKDLGTGTDEEIKKESEIFRAFCFLQRVDEARYADLWDDLKKGIFWRRDKCLKTILKAYELLIHISRQIGYVNKRNNFRNNWFRNTRNFILAQQGRQNRNRIEADNPPKTVLGRDDVQHDNVLCFMCNHMGHYAK